VSATPLVVAIGGTTRPGSSSERALAIALDGAAASGARTQLFGGAFLARLPLFDPTRPARSDAEQELVGAVREADGLIVASPGYHGGVSGLVKNALDLLEDLRGDERPYLDGRAVGCIVTAAGWQSSGTTLAALRSVVHALRGWPTPLGVTLNTAAPADDVAAANLGLVGHQVVEFAQRRHAVLSSVPP
jgi:FMN reductase